MFKWGESSGSRIGWIAALFVIVAIPLLLARKEERRGGGASDGVIIESVQEGSALEKAGVLPGDYFLLWTRRGGSSLGSKKGQGIILDPFDWRWLQIEQAPRGDIELVGQRRGRYLSLVVSPGSWESTVRPVMPEASLLRFRAGQEALAQEGPAEARVAWQSLLAPGADGRLRRWLLWQLGLKWLHLRDWEPGQVVLKEALELPGADPGIVVQLSLRRSILQGYLMQRNLPAAERAVVEEESICRILGGENLCQADVLLHRGQIANDQGDFEKAKEYLNESIDLSTGIAPVSNIAVAALNILGRVDWRRGDLDAAETDFLLALKDARQLSLGGLWEGRLLHALSNLSSMRGDLDLGARRAEKALVLLESAAPDSYLKAVCLTNLALIARARGDLVAAGGFLRKASEFWGDRYELTMTTSIIASTRGLILSEQGDLVGAALAFERSYNISQALIPDGVEASGGLLHLADLARFRGDYLGAQEYLQESSKILLRLAPISLKMTEVLESQGLVAESLGDLVAAEGNHIRALEILRKTTPNGLPEANSLRYLGKLALRRADLHLARERQAAALKIYRALAPQSEFTAESLFEMARVLRRMGRRQEGLRFALESLDMLGRVGLRWGATQQSRIHFRSRKAEYYRETLSLLLELDSPEEAFHVLERSRSRAFLELLAERDLAFRNDIPEDLQKARQEVATGIDQTLGKMAGLSLRDDAEAIEEHRRHLGELHRRHRDLEERLRSISPRLAKLQYPRPLAVGGARETLDPGTFMVTFSVGPTAIEVFVLSSSGPLRVKTLDLGEEELRRRVVQLRRHMESPVSGGGAETDGLQFVARSLYEDLLRPIEAWIADARRLLILPDGPLYHLPFAALVRSKDSPSEGAHRWEYFGEWKALHQASSVTVYSELRGGREGRGVASVLGESGSSTLLVAFGDPSFGPGPVERDGDLSGLDLRVRSVTERGLFDWQPLPHSRREVLSIIDLLPQSRAFLGAEATEERVRALGKEPRILHFATHAFVDDGMPMNSGLMFSLPRDPGEGQENGLLQVWEIFEDVRFDADLVVLSACQTGTGEISWGEGLLSLSRAFQYAGARSVVASLWNVADEATAELMIRFYQHLKKGESKDEALRQAQLEFIRGPVIFETEGGDRLERDFSAPYYWAAFQLIGDWK